MNSEDIAKKRLLSQHIFQADFTSAKDVVSYMGAMQAQDYTGALWGIGLRTQNLTFEDIEHTIRKKEIVRTWPMRGTLHFVAPEDIRWMVKLLAPRVTAVANARRKALEIDDDVIEKSRKVIIDSLSGNNCLTRAQICDQLDRKGVSTSGQRGIHLLRYFSEEGLLCYGPHEGKQPTFVLLEEWVPPSKEMSKEESLATLAEKYFTSHGPATLKDFAGWGYMTMTDARIGIGLAENKLTFAAINGEKYWFKESATSIPEKTAFLLPGFDEYMLGYKDRSPALAPEYSDRIVPGGNGMFLATIVIDGQVVGTWKKTVRKKGVTIQLIPFEKLSNVDLDALQKAAKRYGRFINQPVEVTL